MLRKLTTIMLQFPLFPALINIISRINRPRFLTHFIIKLVFIKIYKVKTDEIEKPLSRYDSLIQFFTRKLKPGARSFPASSRAICSPVDATVLNYGTVTDSTMLQAKGRYYNIRDFINPISAARYLNGSYITLYLAPDDYHRIHQPVNGEIFRTDYHPGRTLPVNSFSLHSFPDVFSKNKRIITYYKLKKKCIAMAMIGALNVGQIELKYDPLFYKNRKKIKTEKGCYYSSQYRHLTVSTGEEAAVFKLGSCVILLLEKGLATLAKIQTGVKIKAGTTLAKLNK
ncbi:MAG TPA: archaetidylserine decarboxylase [Spirochaetota bacterium]|nr:archaetidylserine decarboxylase [Spirochaetota bacterium]